MTKSPEDILKGLTCCAVDDVFCGPCTECPYTEDNMCSDKLKRDAIELFKELTDENARLKSENMVLQMNLDTAIEEIEGRKEGYERLDKAMEDIFLS